jgi:uncharacterized membrane protein YkvA (DUF1232 family)
MNWFGALKKRIKQFKLNAYTLYLAYKDPRVPWHARIFGAIIVGYAFSPIDLIPDFIPVLGYLDDLILLPLGIYFAIKMIPKPIWDEHRAKAADMLSGGKPKIKKAAIVIIALWILASVAAGYVIYNAFL